MDNNIDSTTGLPKNIVPPLTGGPEIIREDIGSLDLKPNPNAVSNSSDTEPTNVDPPKVESPQSNPEPEQLGSLKDLLQGIDNAAQASQDNFLYTGEWSKYDKGANALTKGENHRAHQQSGWAKAANGTIKAANTLITMPTIGLLGVAESAVRVLTSGLSDETIGEAFRGDNNFFFKQSDDFAAYLQKVLPNHRTDAENERVFPIVGEGWQNFVFNDLFGAAAFTGGAILQELALSTLTGVTGGAAAPLQVAATGRLAQKATQVSRLFGRMKSAVRKGNFDEIINDKILDDIAKSATINNIGKKARQLTTGSYFEAGMEARGFLTEAEQNIIANLKESDGIDIKSLEELKEINPEKYKQINDDLKLQANVVMLGNMALISASNAVTLPSIFDGLALKTGSRELASQATTDIVQDAGTGLWKAAHKSYSKLGKTGRVLYHTAKDGFMEGVVEEGGQGVLSGGAMNYVTSKYSPEGTQNAISMINGYIDAFAHQYGTTEGLKEVLIGAVIGKTSSFVQNAKGNEVNGLDVFTGDWGKIKADQEKMAKDINSTFAKKNLTETMSVVVANFESLKGDGKTILSNEIAENDAFFRASAARHRAGMGDVYESDVNHILDNIKSIEDYKDFAANSKGVTPEDIEVGDKSLDQIKNEIRTHVKEANQSVAKALKNAKKIVSNEDLDTDYEEALAYTIHSINHLNKVRATKIGQINKSFEDTFDKLGVDGIDAEAIADVNRFSGPIKEAISKRRAIDAASSPEVKKKLLAEYDVIAKEIQTKSKAKKPNQFKNLSIEKITKVVENANHHKRNLNSLLKEHPYIKTEVDNLFKEVEEATNRQKSAIWEFEQLTSTQGKRNFLSDIEIFKKEIEKHHTRKVDKERLTRLTGNFLDQKKALTRDLARKSIQERLSRTEVSEQEITEELQKSEDVVDKSNNEYIFSVRYQSDDIQTEAVKEAINNHLGKLAPHSKNYVKDPESKESIDKNISTLNSIKKILKSEIQHVTNHISQFPEGEAKQDFESYLTMLNNHMTEVEQLLVSSAKDLETVVTKPNTIAHVAKFISEIWHYDNNEIKDNQQFFRENSGARNRVQFKIEKSEHKTNPSGFKPKGNTGVFEKIGIMSNNKDRNQQSQYKVTAYIKKAFGTNEENRELGIVLDPRRFHKVVDKEKVPLDPNDVADLKLFNPAFVSAKGNITQKGLDFQHYFTEMSKMMDKIYEYDTDEEIPNEVWAKHFKLYSSTRSVALNSNKEKKNLPIDEAFKSNHYVDLGDGVKGLVIFDRRRGDYYIKDNDGIREVNSVDDKELYDKVAGVRESYFKKHTKANASDPNIKVYNSIEEIDGKLISTTHNKQGKAGKKFEKLSNKKPNLEIYAENGANAENSNIYLYEGIPPGLNSTDLSEAESKSLEFGITRTIQDLFDTIEQPGFFTDEVHEQKLDTITNGTNGVGTGIDLLGAGSETFISVKNDDNRTVYINMNLKSAIANKEELANDEFVEATHEKIPGFSKNRLTIGLQVKVGQDETRFRNIEVKRKDNGNLEIKSGISFIDFSLDNVIGVFNQINKNNGETKDEANPIASTVKMSAFKKNTAPTTEGIEQMVVTNAPSDSVPFFVPKTTPKKVGMLPFNSTPSIKNKGKGVKGKKKKKKRKLKLKVSTEAKSKLKAIVNGGFDNGENSGSGPTPITKSNPGVNNSTGHLKTVAAENKKLSTLSRIIGTPAATQEVNEKVLEIITELSNATGIDLNLDLTKLNLAKVNKQIKDYINDNTPKDTKDNTPFKITNGNFGDSIDRQKAVDNLKSILGDHVSVDRLETILHNFDITGIPHGLFSNGIIYLAENLPKGTEYHEAFHYVFRTILKPSEKASLYRAMKKANKLSPKELQAELTQLQGRVTQYENLTNQELLELYYEEKLADMFQDYMNNDKAKKPKSLIRRIFDQLIDLIKSIFNKSDEVENLFKNISEGKYKNFNPKFTPPSVDLAFSLKKIDEDESEAIQYYNANEAKKFISIITRNVLNRLKNEKLTNELILEETQKFSDNFKDENWNNEIKELSKREDFDKLSKVLHTIGLRRDSFNVEDSNNPNIKEIIKEVRNSINFYDVSALDSESSSEADENNNGGVQNFDKSKFELGGFGNLSKRIKQYISLIPYAYDEFNLGLEFSNLDNTDPKHILATDGPQIYTMLARGLSDTTRENIIKRIQYLGNTDVNMNVFRHEFFRDVMEELNGVIDHNGDITSLTVEELSKSNTYNLISNGFYQSTSTFMTMIFDTENTNYKILNANQKDVQQVQFDRWRNKFTSLMESKKLKGGKLRKEVLQRLKNIQLQIDKNVGSVFTDPDTIIENIRNEFKELGITLDPEYIKLNLYSYINFGGSSKTRKQGLINKIKNARDENEAAAYREALDTVEAFSEVPLFLSEHAAGGKLVMGMGAHIKIMEQTKDEQVGPEGPYSSTDFSNNRNNANLGLSGLFLEMAKGNAVFDPSVVDSTFQNSEGKTIYPRRFHSFYTEQIMLWRSDRKELVKELFKYATATDIGKGDLTRKQLLQLIIDNGIVSDPYDAKMMLEVFVNNPLIKGMSVDKEGNVSLENLEYAQQLFETLTYTIQDGLVIDNVNDAKETGIPGALRRTARTFKSSDRVSKTLMNMMQFADSSATFNKNKFSTDTRLFNTGVIAEKSTNYNLRLPIHNFFLGGKPSGFAVDWMSDLLNQEFTRIARIANEIRNPELATRKIKNYNTGFKQFTQQEMIEAKTDVNKAREIFDKMEQTLIDKANESGAGKVNFSGLDFFNFYDLDVDTRRKLFIAAIQGKKINTVDSTREALKKFMDTEVKVFSDKLLELGLITGDRKNPKNKLLPKEYVGGAGLHANIGNYFLNDWLNSFAISNILDGDYAMMYKNPTDVVKRNGLKNASGNSVGYGQSKVMYTNDETFSASNPFDLANPFRQFTNEELLEKGYTQEEIDNIRDFEDHGVKLDEKTEVELADGFATQGLRNTIMYLKNKGVYTKEVEKIYMNKIRTGVELTPAEYRILKENNADIRSRKFVYKDLTGTMKMSMGTVTRGLASYSELSDESLLALWDKYDRNEISIQDVQEAYTARPGYEKFHEFLNLEEDGVVEILASTSVSKSSTANVSEFKDGKWSQQDPTIIENTNMREQVITDGNKSEITDGTQKLGLIFSEQNPLTPVTIKGTEFKLSQLQTIYEGLLALRNQQGLENIVDVINKDGQADFEYLYSKFIESLKQSNVDPYLLEIFKVDELNRPVYNWNFSAIVTKFESMFLSSVSKNSLKQKTAGTKYTLYPGQDIKVNRNLDGSVTPHKQGSPPPKKSIPDRLRHRIKDKDGTYYSEVMISKEILDKYDVKLGETISISEHIAKELGVRIPTEDKYSMINIRIVDFLPREYGNSIVLPAEIQYLSGADFDIDSLFSNRYELYTNVSGINKFGGYLTSKNPVETAYEEFKLGLFKTPKAKLLVKKNKYSDQQLLIALGQPDTFKDFEAKYGRRIKRNIKAFKKGDLTKYKPLSREENNNTLLDIQNRFVQNSGNKVQAASGANFDPFLTLRQFLKDRGIAKKVKLSGSVHNQNNKQNAAEAIDIGGANIGPAAKMNITFQLLANFSGHLSIISNSVGNLFGQRVIGPTTIENGKFLNEDKARINGLISSVLAAMTDNAKEQFASEFNLTKEMIGPALIMISSGLSFNKTMMILKQPAIVRLSNKIDKAKSSVLKREEKRELKTKMKDIIDEMIGEYPTSEEDYKLTEKDLIESLKNGASTDDANKLQHYLLLQFRALADINDNFKNVAIVTDLAKGLSGTWSDVDRIFNAIDKLNIKYDSETKELYFADNIIPVPITNFGEILLANSYLKSQIENLFELDNQAKKFFISRTDKFKKIFREIASGLKTSSIEFSDNKNKVVSSMMAYLQNKAFIKKNNIDVSQVRVEQLMFDENYMKSQVNALREELPENLLLQFLKFNSYELTPKSPYYDGTPKSITVIEGDTRNKYSETFIEQLTNDFLALAQSNNSDHKNFAIDLFEYIMVKDSLKYSNNGLVKQIAPQLLTKVTRSLGEVHENFLNDESHKDLLGENIPEEFFELFTRNPQNMYTFVRGRRVRDFKVEKARRLVSWQDSKQSLIVNVGEGVKNDHEATLATNIKNLTNGEGNQVFEKVLPFIRPGKASEDAVIIAPRIIRMGVQITQDAEGFFRYTKGASVKTVLFKLHKVKDYRGNELPITGNTSVGHSFEYIPVAPIGNKDFDASSIPLSTNQAMLTPGYIPGVSTEPASVEEVSTEENAAILGASELSDDISEEPKKKKDKKKKFKSSLSGKKGVTAASFGMKDQLDSHLQKVTIKHARTILEKLRTKFGIEYAFSTEIRGLGAYDESTNIVYLNPNKMRLDTLYHEFAHPFIAAIKKTNKPLYRQLEREVMKDKALVERLKENGYKTNELIEEAIVTKLGEHAAQISQPKKLTNILNKFLKFIKEILGIKNLDSDTIPANTTIIELAELLVNEDIMINRNKAELVTQQKVDDLIEQLSKCE